ncbi:MAG TPA: 30S ribosomal protein S2 [Candidatus Bipolaricaulota bacterium]|nr:30S ribosomal protein S2 [Candidatus Bipolaricaulota bacterium]
MEIPSLLDMLKAGVHFGHQKGKWHPKMKPYIYGVRNGVHIINLETTQKKLEEALNFIKETVAKGGTVLFLGTKTQAKDSVREAAISCGMPFIVERWLGGTFTNLSTILKLIKKYQRMKMESEKGEWDKFTKKEKLVNERALKKLDKIIGGLATLEKLPSVIYIVDMKEEKTAVIESNRVGVPVVAICDTNVNQTKAAYPIPANDDATRSIEMITGLVAEAVKEGKKEAEKRGDNIKIESSKS